MKALAFKLCLVAFRKKKKKCVFKTSIEWNPLGLRAWSPGSKI